MSFSLLTNIAALESDLSVSLTRASLQTTERQLSSGSRINSASDDSAGLAIVAGLGANCAALTQSAANAEAGIGLLQVADGALSQVTVLLDRAVTLATEAANGALNSGQVSSADAEYQGILSEIDNIGATTLSGQAVFSNAPTSIYVGDGTPSNNSEQSFDVGGLSLASIGQTPGAQVTGPVALAIGSPATAISSVAGVYTLNTAAAGDTLSGTLSIQVGGNGPVTPLTVVAGTTQTQLEALVNGNGTLAAEGVTATLDGGANLQINGPSSGSALSFAGTSLEDAQSSTPFVPTATTASSPAVPAGSYAFESNAIDGNDPIVAGGTLTATFNGQTFQYNAPAGTVLGDVLSEVQAVFGGSDISVFVSYGSSSIPGRSSYGLGFNGALGVAGDIVLTTSLVDVDNGGPFLAGIYAAGVPGVVPYTTYAFASDTSVFSGNLAITAGGHAAATVATAGLTGQQAAAAINAYSTLQGYGVSATYDNPSHQLVIYGNPDGTETISSAGASGTIYQDPLLTSLGTTSAPVAGVAAHGGTVTVVLGSYDDTVAGNLNLTLGSSGTPQDALLLMVAPGTTGLELANRVNADAGFQAAGVTAAYDGTNETVTLTAPAGLANTLATTGTALIDTGGENPLPGTSLNGALSSLRGGDAAAVLQAITSAVVSVSYQRGVLGADLNQLTAESDVAKAQTVNLTAASNAIQATDYGVATSNLAKYEVLSQTGFAALALTNRQAMEVIRLLE